MQKILNKILANQSSSTEINLCIYSELNLTRIPRIYHGERIVFSTNGAGKTAYPHVKE